MENKKCIAFLLLSLQRVFVIIRSDMGHNFDNELLIVFGKYIDKIPSLSVAASLSCPEIDVVYCPKIAIVFAA